MMAERDGKQYTGGAKKTFLTVPVNASAETLTVADASSFPDPVPIATPALGDPVPASSLPFVVTIARGTASEEKVLIQSRVGNTLTVVAGERGYDGTAASSQSEQASVEHTIDAFSMSKFMEHTNDPALTDAHFIPQINGLSAKITALDNHVDAASTTAHAISNVTGLQAALNAKAPDADLTTAEGRITVNEGDISAIEGAATTLTGRVTTAEGDITAIEGQVTAGLGLRQVVTFYSSGTFTKADYAWLRAVRVRCQGGGSGGGSAPAGTSTTVGIGRAGRGGVYSESMLLASALSASETVTVGAAGAGGTSGGTGSAGGESSFGTHVVAPGGSGSAPSYSSGGPLVTGGPTPLFSGTATGDLVIESGGGTGSVVLAYSNNQALGEGGGSSHMGGGAPASRNDTGTPAAGGAYGGGGAGAVTRTTEAVKSGAAGGPGVVILELYA